MGGGNTPLIASNMYTLCSPSNLTLIISDNETGTSHLRTADQPTYRKHKGQFQNPRNLLFFPKEGKTIYLSIYFSCSWQKGEQSYHFKISSQRLYHTLVKLILQAPNSIGPRERGGDRKFAIPRFCPRDTLVNNSPPERGGDYKHTRQDKIGGGEGRLDRNPLTNP